MISIATARYWWIWVAVNADDNHTVHIAFGLTEKKATQNLIRQIEKYYEGN